MSSVITSAPRKKVVHADTRRAIVAVGRSDGDATTPPRPVVPTRAPRHPRVRLLFRRSENPPVWSIEFRLRVRSFARMPLCRSNIPHRLMNSGPAGLQVSAANLLARAVCASRLSDATRSKRRPEPRVCSFPPYPSHQKESYYLEVLNKICL
jgi:hypothetical protein